MLATGRTQTSSLNVCFGWIADVSGWSPDERPQLHAQQTRSSCSQQLPPLSLSFWPARSSRN